MIIYKVDKDFLGNKTWGDEFIDFYITDEAFPKVVKVSWDKKDRKAFCTIVTSFTGRNLEPSNLLELLVVTGLTRGDIEELWIE